jgi:hypothetical protein
MLICSLAISINTKQSGKISLNTPVQVWLQVDRNNAIGGTRHAIISWLQYQQQV